MTMQKDFGIAGSGLGLHRAFMLDLQNEAQDCIDSFEIMPENWLGIGGKWI